MEVQEQPEAVRQEEQKFPARKVEGTGAREAVQGLGKAGGQGREAVCPLRKGLGGARRAAGLPGRFRRSLESRRRLESGSLA